MNKNILRQAGFGAEVDRVEAGLCPFCGKPVNQGDFRDELSRKEYKISGICQVCQDETFGAIDNFFSKGEKNENGKAH